MNDQVLPKLREGEEFVCDEGCGTTVPEQYDFEYFREEFEDGRVISKTVKAYRSNCCKGDLSVFSNVDDTFTPFDEYR